MGFGVGVGAAVAIAGGSTTLGLALMLVKNANRAKIGTPLQGDGSLRGKLSLPFGLTGAQSRSIREIEGMEVIFIVGRVGRLVTAAIASVAR